MEKLFFFVIHFMVPYHIDNEWCGKLGFQAIERVIANFTFGVISLFNNKYIVNMTSMGPFFE